MTESSPPIPETLAVSVADLDALVSRLLTRSDRRYMTIPTAAIYTDLSEESIRRLLSSGKLHGYRPVKGRILVDRVELDAVVKGATAEPRKGRGLHRRGA